MATSSPSCPELLPLSAYENVRAVSYPRLAFLSGALFFVLMTITQVDMLVWNAISGILFGLFFAKAMLWQLKRITRQLYDGSSPWIPPAPPGEYIARMASSQMRGHIAVGGHLYVGREAWVFMPHTKNLRAHREPMRWDRPGRLVLSTEPVRSRWVTIILGSKLPDRLGVSLGGFRDQFVVPDAQLAVFELQKIVAMSAQ
jgi:hypothetical protein